MRLTMLTLSVLVACGTKSEDNAKNYRAASIMIEAKVKLTQLGKSALEYKDSNGTFLVGKAGPVPAAPCCKEPGGKCAVAPEQWSSSDVWSKLGFEATDAVRFQYSYESDGTTVSATAVGDPDCDGKPLTVKLELPAGVGPDGKITLVEPNVADD